MSTIALPPRQPLLACATVIEEALSEVAEAEPVYLPTPAKADLLRRLAVIEARVAELQLRVMASADDVVEAVGARDVGSWLAAETRQGFEAPRAAQQLAVALDHSCGGVRVALRDGLVNVAQARVIVQALQELPDDLDPDVIGRAERALVGYATDYNPKQLRILGRRILEVVDPAAADVAEAKRLQAEEARARAKTKLTLRTLGDGTTRLSGVIPDAAAARLRIYLESFTNPRKHDGASADVFPGSYPRRLGQAFCQLLEAVEPKRLPIHGGDATTVVVTIGLDQLRQDLGAGEVIGGDRVSAAELRRLACTAKIVPAVLGGSSEVLDLGRGSRVFEAAQRRAMLLRDRACRAEGCSVPGTWCEAHHWLAWSAGGRTDLADGVLLCGHHHHRVHDPGYTAQRLPNGDVRFARRS